MSTISRSGENADANYTIDADRRENILYLEFSGTLTAEEMTEAAEETITAADGLEDGFGIINDISEFQYLTKFGTDTAPQPQMTTAGSAEDS